MPTLQLETAADTLPLNGYETTGRGVQVQSGVTGLGLPPLSVQWLEGAGDGATYRGTRVLPRDIDLPLYVKGADREDLKVLLAKLAKMLSGKCTLRLIEDDGKSWYCDVYRVGGGGYIYGADTTGKDDAMLVITMRAGDPYWTSNTPMTQIVESDKSGLLPNMTQLHLAHTKALETMELINTGDAPAFPVWTVTGPGTKFTATNADGESFVWNGTLADGDILTIDTRTGAVVDNHGNNRYADMQPGPVLWRLPPGTTTATTSLENTGLYSAIDCKFYPRRWLVV